ncbi:adenylylsulfate kinase [Fusibacter ferrireducens]|uniref:Adenylylsulfate kinase n=1 Tax=Fusibacter ferrireducens TaxID=2785058 RepID=A0ABR9ZWD2_9FIRM|nr:adenylylsulfate kinase [Fusibacter ferrireducens]MBF4694443.1 adenylylsulfate kinase [Fusibacter ferrireducens]
MCSLNVEIPKLDDYSNIPKGDMPGDKIEIDKGKIEKAEAIFLELMKSVPSLLEKGKIVISVYGGSGVGKSEIGSLLAYYFNHMKIKAYLMSGDNYPHRIPMQNDAERLRVFREYGIKGLVASGKYSRKINEDIIGLQALDLDFDPKLCNEHPELEIYQEKGKESLFNYLGTDKELDFSEINGIIEQFKNGSESIFLKRMGREIHELWYEMIPMKEVQILIIEWTHGNNPNLVGIDMPIFLNSTPEETKAHRRSRNRDGNIDSPFTNMVLEIEQAKLYDQAQNAKLIVLKSGEIVSFEQFKKI